MITNLEVLWQVWFAILAFILLLYATLDGFDLGVGIISLFARSEESRGLMMGSLGTIWDANETWLVLFGGILFGAFPLIYGLVLSALYVPLVLMLVGLIFRAVSFEFRPHSENPAIWSRAFGLGSLVAALTQGFALGGVMSGISIQVEYHHGGLFNWITPLSIAVALGVVCLYVLLGSTYLVAKSVGETQKTAYAAAYTIAPISLFLTLAGFLWSGVRYEFIRPRWFGFPQMIFTVGGMIVAAVCMGMVIVSLSKGWQRAPFFWVLGFAASSFLALGASFYPNLIPPAVTAGDAAAQPMTMQVMLIVIAVFLPVLLAYNIYQFWVFRGKVTSNVYDEQ